jgi:hypothetical protein
MDPLNYAAGALDGLRAVKGVPDLSDKPQVLAAMKYLYCKLFAEDARDGTAFDCRVLDALDQAAAPQLRAEPATLVLPYVSLKIDWNDQRTALDILGYGTGRRLRLSVPLAAHAITYAKRFARANANRMTMTAGHTFTDPPQPQTMAQRMSSFGFRGTPVGELWGLAPRFRDLIDSFVEDEGRREFMQQKHWVYAAVGRYTINKTTLWIVNFGGTDA